MKENIKDGLRYFPEIKNTGKILILGTFPSDDSLSNNQYYYNSSNRFWTMLEDVLEEPGLKDSSYKNKENVLSKYGIILWDSIAKCERKGSGDSSIVENTAQPNDIIKEVFKINKNKIKIIIINGVTVKNNEEKLGARGWFEKFNGEIEKFESENNVKVICLHSTSKANRDSNFDISEWRNNIRPYINSNKSNYNKIIIVKKRNRL